jgi:hypothetical protein
VPGIEVLRSVLPLIATTSLDLRIDDTHVTMLFSNSSRSNAEKTRLNMSRDGMPLGRFRKPVNRVYLK